VIKRYGRQPILASMPARLARGSMPKAVEAVDASTAHRCALVRPDQVGLSELHRLDALLSVVLHTVDGTADRVGLHEGPSYGLSIALRSSIPVARSSQRS
jgi:hypothetical protein